MLSFVVLAILLAAIQATDKSSRLDSTLQALRDNANGVVHLATMINGSPFEPKHAQSSLITITATGNGSALLKVLNEMGLRNGARLGNAVSGQLAIEKLRMLDSVDKSVMQVVRRDFARTRAGSVTSQADSATFASDLRTMIGNGGTNITIGVLSDSFNCLSGRANDIANGDLPVDTVVLQEILSCSGAIDEGRAMAQLIHDIAPGAAIKFCSAFNGFVLFAQCIDLLVESGCHIIVDDIFYFDEAFFQDDLVAQAVDRAVADGVAYFSAAGNEASQSYESAFRNSEVASTVAQLLGGKMHDFNPSSGIDTKQRISISHSGTRSYSIVLQWDEPYARISGGEGCRSDLDICLLRTTGVARACATANNIGGDAVEILQFQLSEAVDGKGALLFDIVVTLYAGLAPTKIKYIYLNSQITVLDYPTDSSTVVGHSNAAGALSTGAVSYKQTPKFGKSPPLLEAFSSRGGTAVLFANNGTRHSTPSTRRKPDISCIDGTDTTFFGSDAEGNSFPNFFGTSAAAPHAAALAALLMKFSPTATVSQIYDAMRQGAVEMLTPGFDYSSGFGLCNALIASKRLCSTDCSDNNPCTIDTCGSSGCIHTAVAASANITCRAAVGVCDLAEKCNGTPVCPTDKKQASGTMCRASPPYPQQATCNGLGAVCPCPRAVPTSIVGCPAKSYAFHTLDMGNVCISFDKIKYAARSSVTRCPRTTTFTPDAGFVSGSFVTCKIVTDSKGDITSFSLATSPNTLQPRRATFVSCGSLTRARGANSTTAVSSSTGVFKSA